VTNLDKVVCAALIQSSFPPFLSHCRKLSDQELPERECELERSPFGPTRAPPLLIVYAHLHTGMASNHRGVPPGCFSQATCSRSGRVTSLASPVRRISRFLLPAELTIEAMVEIDTGIVVGLSFIAAGQTAEEFAPTLFDPKACAI
jgi:hypothetical protein